MELVRIIAALALIVGLLWIALRLLKQRRFSHRNLSLLQYFPLGPKRGIAAVKVFGEVLVVGVTSQNISLLKTFPAEDMPDIRDGESESPSDFRSILGGLR